MAMTTVDGTKLGQNVITDVNANVPVEHAPQRVLSHEATLLFKKGLVAKPLMSPEVSSVHVKNNEYRYRWVNLKAQGGWMYSMRKTQGFTNATKDDVDLLGGDVAVSDGALTAGDLILMKIQADLYDGAILNNMSKAMRDARMRGVYTDGAPEAEGERAKRVSVSQEPFVKNSLAKPFIPDNPDTYVENSISSGRVEKTRAVVQNLRDSAK